MAEKRYRLGVLFVHGIGTQPSSNTLVQWGDQLLKVIQRSSRGSVVPRVERADPGDAASGEPAEACVRFFHSGLPEPGENTERWLLSEAWWAESFPSPSYSELVSWSLRAVPWALAIHIAQRYWQAEPATLNEPGPARKRVLAARLFAVLQLLIALALAPAVILALVLTLVLGLLPIPQLRSVMLSVQSRLTGTMGDSLAFVESPVRAGLIRTRILTRLERLIDKCDHTIIVAHSQGAAAVLDALGGVRDAEAPAQPAGPVPDTLLTFGAGINQLVSLKVLSLGLPKSIPGNPVYLGILALLGAAAVLAMLVRDIRAGTTTLVEVAKAGGVLAVALAAIVGMFYSARGWIRRAKGQGSDSKANGPREWVLAAGMIAIIGVAMYYSDRFNLPLQSLNLLMMAVVTSAGSLALILSSDIKKAVTAPVQEPHGLGSWVDLHASADPVPNGPTRIKSSKGLRSIPIWNRGSMFSDHTSYWQNLDGFVLRVARECGKTAGSSWLYWLLPLESVNVDRRARWRVQLLRLAVWITRTGWLVILFLVWNKYGLLVPLPMELPGWVPFGNSAFVKSAFAPLAIGAAAWLTSKLLYAVWAIWTAEEQQQALTGSPYSSGHTFWYWAMGVPVSLVVWLAALTLDFGASITEMVKHARESDAAVAVTVGGSLIYALITRWLCPPPASG